MPRMAILVTVDWIMIDLGDGVRGRPPSLPRGREEGEKERLTPRRSRGGWGDSYHRPILGRGTARSDTAGVA